MRTRTSPDSLTTRDKIEGWIFGSILAIGLPALVFVTTQ
jgi:hypothetical protein